MPGSALILVSLPDGRWLALEPSRFAEAVARGAELMPPVAAVPAPAPTEPELTPEELLTAKQMAKLTGVPATWFLDRARLNDLPHVRAGKYVRFNPRVVEAYLARLPSTDTRITKPDIALK